MKIKYFDKKIKKLKEYFIRNPQIVMAYLFGSYAKGKQMQESDFDIAVYFKSENNKIECEEIRQYPQEDKIWSDVEKIVGCQTDFIVLNRVASTLAFEILRTGKPIIIKDSGIFIDFYLLTSSTAEDFRKFIKDFWEIEQRSASLSETDKIRLIKRIKFLEDEISAYSIFTDIDLEIYTKDRIKRLSVERWIENIVNASIDIAKILLASEKKKIPETYRETLELLSIYSGFNKQDANKLAEFSRLRNILAHEYLDIRFEQIKKFIQEAKPVYKNLIVHVKKLL